ncbi:MAG: hypothetical protein J6P61_00935 [Erysipelotrichaceae bacterium]|nr:hypothetical protein [Erysipelotrichaceae bacterium]
MAYRIFTVNEDGFLAYMVLPEQRAKLAVIMMFDGDVQLPATDIVRYLSDLGYIGVYLPLYGGRGQSRTPNCIPLEYVEMAVGYLRQRLNVQKIILYGMGLGSVFACYGAYYLEDVDGVIMVSPTHVNYSGVGSRRRQTGHSLVTYKGEELPYLTVDFKVSHQFDAFNNAYWHFKEEEMALLPISKLKSKILILASDSDEVWPAAYSLKKMEYQLKDDLYPYAYRTHIFHNASHYIGLFPETNDVRRYLRQQLVTSNTERRHRKICNQARDESATMIYDFFNEIISDE